MNIQNYFWLCKSFLYAQLLDRKTSWHILAKFQMGYIYQVE